MKTNLSALMNLIEEDEKQYSAYDFGIINYVFNTTIQELDGKKNVIEDNKKEFTFQLSELERLAKEIASYKRILYQKNNSFKLSDGRTIQEAISDNTKARRLKESLGDLLNIKSKTTRVTEVNNSYFEIKEVNYNSDKIKTQIKELDDSIQKTDFEISKLNSIEFKI
jgi:hypothetical protein